MPVDVSLFAYGFTHHKKVRKLSNEAFRLWVSAIDHAYEDGTGGIVVASDIDHFPHAPKAGAPRADAIAELTAAGLWHARDGISWSIHDFDEWRALQLSLEPHSVAQAGTPSQIGGAARAASAVRVGGKFAPRAHQPTPAEHQPAGENHQPDTPADTSPTTSRLVSGPPADTPAESSDAPAERTSQMVLAGGACFPPHPLSDQKEAEGSERASDSGSSDQPENKGSARGRRARLPAKWSPNPDHVARAAVAGLSLAEEAEKFRLHAEATGRVMANWNAAFTTWLINAKKWAPKTVAKFSAFDAQKRAREIAEQERLKLTGGT